MRYLILLLVLLVAGCNSNSKEEKKGSSKNHEVVKAYYPDGKLRAEIPQKDKKKHGLAKEYFKNGKRYQEIDYKNGIKEGWARRFYENGQLAQETPYINGQIHGTQKKFREDGSLSAESIYFEDEPCIGLKEYLLDGSLKNKYPQIVVTPVDQIRENGTYVLRLNLTEKSKEVEFYTGSLTNGKYIGSQAKRIWNVDRNGMGEITYNLLPGMFIMEKVNVIAKIQTKQGNYLIAQASINVAAENR
jgi:hypothetical protein